VTSRLQAIAFIGTGLMGVQLVRRMLAAGFGVRVWNRTPARADELIASGATRSTTVGEACDGADVVCVCVSNADAVESSVFSESGVASARRPPSVLVDFSTIGPDATMRFASRLAAQCGTAWLDAPVSGGPTGAAAGKLVIFAGGDAGHVANMQPLFACVSQRVTHFGATGNGQAAKVCNQVIVAVTLLAIAEALALAEAASLDAEQLVEALTGGYADSIPLQIFGRRMARREFEPKLGELRLMAKDLGLAAQIAGSRSPMLPIVAAAAGVYDAACRSGLAAADLSTLITLLESGQAGDSTPGSR
jgi:3-hydroxyisobutyrate dehydrogenase-like beta-hydroxyacid dehydrogenase